MDVISIKNMGGISPRLSPRLIPPNAATVAENCKLWSGEVRPFRIPLPISAALAAGVVKTIFRTKAGWLSWDKPVDVVESFIPGAANEVVYFAGGDGLRVGTTAAVVASVTAARIAGVPAPAAAPTVVVGVGGTGDVLTRAYVYTETSDLGEESPPSPASVIVNAMNTQSVVVSGFSPPSANSVTRNIYRLDTGARDTEWLFVAEMPVAIASYNDTVNDLDLEELLPSQDWKSFPADLEGVVLHPGGFLVGFVGKQIFVGERFQAMYRVVPFTVEHTIVGLGVYGNTVVIATEGHPYTMSGSTPSTMSIDKSPEPYPCLSRRSIASGEIGVVYASTEGLVRVGYGGVQVITRSVLTRDEWTPWNPRSMHGVIHDGRYVGFYQVPGQAADVPYPTGGGFIFDINDRATGVEQRDKLTTLSIYATASHVASDVSLYMVAQDGANPSIPSGGSWRSQLLLWGAGAVNIPARWRSKVHVMPYLTNFGAAKVMGEQTTPYRSGDDYEYTRFFLIIDGVVRFTREVRANEPFRLPRFRRDTEGWQVEVVTTKDVYEIVFAHSIEDLTRRATT